MNRQGTSFRVLVDEGVLELGDGYRAKNEELGGSGPIFLRAAYLQDEGFSLEGPDRFITRDPNQFGRKIALLGDVVITTKGNSTGRVGRIREPEAGAVYSPHLSYWRSLRPDKIDQSFLYYWSQGQEFQEQLRGMASSTDMAPYLSLQDQLRLRISLPPIEEQIETGSLLTVLDEKIEINRQMNQTLETIARTIFKSWFVDFDPVRAKVEGRWRSGVSLPGLPADLFELFPDSFEESSLGQIPRGWQVRALTSIAEIISGGTPKTSVPKFWNGDIDWFSVVDAPAPSDVFVISTERKITREGLDNCAASLLDRNLTIITARGTVGKVALVGVSMAMNQSCYALRPSSGYGRYFLYFDLRSVVSDLQARTHGTVFDTITRDTFDAIDICSPDATLSRRFDEIVSPLLERIRENLFENQALGETRDALLPRLISGELRLSHSDRGANGRL